MDDKVYKVNVFCCAVIQLDIHLMGWLKFLQKMYPTDICDTLTLPLAPPLGWLFSSLYKYPDK